MSQIHIWEVKAKNTPLLKKKCNQCDSERFYCGEKFRMNAQKKNIDIWLIYRCVKCKNTYNMTLFSRTKTESLHKDLFTRFSENNKETAWQYAFSPETRRKNNIEADFESVEYEIKHTPIENILHSDTEVLTFEIKCPFDFGLRASAVLRTCLGLSAGKLNQLTELNAVLFREKALQKKHKIRNGDIVKVDAEKLKKVYCENTGAPIQ